MNANDRKILSKSKLQEIVNQIDPQHTLDPEVEEILLEVADEFIESATSFGCALAKHRGSDTLEVKDLQLHLEKNWGIRIPGYTSESKPYKRIPMTETHKQRVHLVRKATAQLQKGANKKSQQRAEGEKANPSKPSAGNKSSG